MGASVSKPKPLILGTDCSGIEAPYFALKELGVEVEHAFSSDINKHCRALSRLNCNPGIIYDDMTTRDVHKVPKVDLYICGFPCQPFSKMNTRKSSADDRRSIIEYVLEYIAHSKPTMVLLENVASLMRLNDGKVIRAIQKELKSVGYDVYCKVINTAHYGHPQSRNRLYIAAFLRGACKSEAYTWPVEQELQYTVLDLLDNELISPELTNELAPCYKELISKFDIPPNHKGVLEFNQITMKKRPYSTGDFKISAHELPQLCPGKVCPCLVHHDPGIYVAHCKRYATAQEHLSIQGFPKTFKLLHQHHNATPKDKQQEVRRVRKMCGNSMCVHTLAQIIHQMLKCY